MPNSSMQIIFSPQNEWGDGWLIQALVNFCLTKEEQVNHQRTCKVLLRASIVADKPQNQLVAPILSSYLSSRYKTADKLQRFCSSYFEKAKIVCGRDCISPRKMVKNLQKLCFRLQHLKQDEFRSSSLKEILGRDHFSTHTYYKTAA